MYKLLLALVPVIAVLLVSEYFWRSKKLKGERARKFIHILSGVWIAFWPYYLPFDVIFILGCVALTVLVYSRVTNLFHAIYAVKRKTYGDIFYALAIIFCAYFAQAEWIFTVSILLMALADGGAAVVGRFWGIKNQYFVFGKSYLRKSVSGTASYLVFAYLIVAIGWVLGGGNVFSENLHVALLILPVGSTILENISPYGIDNLITPVYGTFLLNYLY